MQAGQRPLRHQLGQTNMAEEYGAVVGQGMELEPVLVVPEAAARAPRPAAGVLAFVDVLLGGATAIIEPIDPLGLHRQVGHRKANAREQPGYPMNPVRARSSVGQRRARQIGQAEGAVQFPHDQ